MQCADWLYNIPESKGFASMPPFLKYFLLVCVIGAGIYMKHSFYGKSYDECSPDEKRFRRIGAVVCGVAAIVSLVVALVRISMK